MSESTDRLLTSAIDALQEMKYWMARRIYPELLDQSTPSEEMTWRQWFKERYHEDIEAYVARARREQIGKAVDARVAMRKARNEHVSVAAKEGQ